MVIEETPTGHSLKLIFGSVHKSLNYYITQKKKHIATIFHISEATPKTLQSDLKKAHFYSILNDGRTDNGVIEQKLIYILF